MKKNRRNQDKWDLQYGTDLYGVAFIFTKNFCLPCCRFNPCVQCILAPVASPAPENEKPEVEPLLINRL